MSLGTNTAAAAKLTALIERMERLLDEIDALRDDLKDMKAEAKAEGFNVQAMVKLVAIRRNKKKALAETELLNDLLIYAHATGTPLDLVLAEPAPEPLPATRPARNVPDSDLSED